jgi:hypothetical protein
MGRWKVSPLSLRASSLTFLSSEGHVTRTYIYETNIWEDEQGPHISTKRIYSARSYLYHRRRPSIALSDKYLVEARVTGYSPEKTLRWKLFLSQYCVDDHPKTSMNNITVLLGKTDDSAVVSYLPVPILCLFC